MCIASPQPSVRPRRLRRPPRSGQGWAGGRAWGQVSSGRRRRCLPTLASFGGAYRRERDSAREPRAAGSSRGREREGEREAGREGRKKWRESQRARAPQPGRGRGRAQRASAPAALRTPHRKPPADVSRAARRAPGTGRGEVRGRRARRGPRQLAAARALAARPPFPQRPPARGSPRWARAGPGGGGAWGRARARASRPAPAPAPAWRAGRADLLVNGSAGLGRPRRGQVGPPARAPRGLVRSPASAPSWLQQLGFLVTLQLPGPWQPGPSDLSEREETVGLSKPAFPRIRLGRGDRCGLSASCDPQTLIEHLVCERGSCEERNTARWDKARACSQGASASLCRRGLCSEIPGHRYQRRRQVPPWEAFWLGGTGFHELLAHAYAQRRV